MPIEAVGLTATRSSRGMPLVIPPKESAVVIGGGFNAAVGRIPVGVICLAAPHPREGEAVAEFHAFDGWDPEQQGGEAVFHPSNMGEPSPAGSPTAAASTIPPTLSAAIRAASTAERMKGSTPGSNRENGTREEGLQLLCGHRHRVEPAVLHPSDGGDMPAHRHAPAAEELLA